MARPSGARFVLEQLTRPCFSFLPSGHHKSHTKSCPWLCCHIFSMSQPCFWKMSKFSPGCDPLLGSPRGHRCGPRPQFLLMSFSISGAVQQGRGGHHMLHLRPRTERSWPASRHRHCCQRGSKPLSCTPRLRQSFRGLNNLLTWMGANTTHPQCTNHQNVHVSCQCHMGPV